jgi:hypothetical protein
MVSTNLDAIREAVDICFKESFPNGIPEEEEELERNKRDFVSRFKMLAQKSTSHEELLNLVMASYDLFVNEIDMRSLLKKKPEEEEPEPSFFHVRKQDWIVYLFIALVTVIGKWCDERYASNFAKRHGMERHVFMKVETFFTLKLKYLKTLICCLCAFVFVIFSY